MLELDLRNCLTWLPQRGNGDVTMSLLNVRLYSVQITLPCEQHARLNLAFGVPYVASVPDNSRRYRHGQSSVLQGA